MDISQIQKSMSFAIIVPMLILVGIVAGTIPPPLRAHNVVLVGLEDVPYFPGEIIPQSARMNSKLAHQTSGLRRDFAIRLEDHQLSMVGMGDCLGPYHWPESQEQASARKQMWMMAYFTIILASFIGWLQTRSYQKAYAGLCQKYGILG